MGRITIIEEDLFIYSLYPDQLDKEKRRFIEENITEFTHEIELCRKLVKEVNINNLEDSRNKIIQRISSNKVEITLLPVIRQSQPNSAFILAAASLSDAEHSSTASFINSDSGFLARVIYMQDFSLIYLFSNSPAASISLTIYPSTTKYVIEDTKKPVKHEYSEIIEKITISKKV